MEEFPKPPKEKYKYLNPCYCEHTMCYTDMLNKVLVFLDKEEFSNNIEANNLADEIENVFTCYEQAHIENDNNVEVYVNEMDE